MLRPAEDYKELSTFSEAAEAAKQASAALCEEVAVKPSAHGWLVLLPPGGRYELSRIAASTDLPAPYVPDLETLTSEFSSDQDDYHSPLR